MPKMQYQDRNDKAIETCDPELRPLLYWMQYKCSRDGRDFLIVEGFRGEKRQNELYADGHSQAAWPNSYHGGGVAIDLVPVVFGIPWKLKWDAFGRYKRIASIFKHWGFEWGGDWKEFKDNPHFQYTDGKTAQDFTEHGYRVKKRKYIDRVKQDMATEERKLYRGLDYSISIKNIKRAKRSQEELGYLLVVEGKVLQ